MAPEAASPVQPASSALAAARSPRYARLLAGILGALLAAVLLALAIVPWQQTAFGSGQLIAYAPLDRQQTIDAPLEGRVVSWYVREGTTVRPGDPIVRLTDNDPEIIGRLRQEQTALQTRLDAARERADRLADRVSDLEASRRSGVAGAGSRTQMARDRVASADQAVSAAQAKVETARVNLDRQQALFAQGLASRRALELARLDLAQAVADRERSAMALSAARSEVGAFTSEQSRLGTDLGAAISEAQGALAAARAEAANVQAELVRVQTRQARQQAQEVRATQAGTIMRLLVASGNQIVKAGDPLAIIVPEADVRAVEVWVRGYDAPFVRVGLTARVQVEGWPAVQVVGWPSVAVGTFPARVAVVDAAADDQGRLRALLVPDPPDAWPSEQFLRQGLQARGWILLNQVPLGFELWRQFNGFPPGVGPGSAPKGGDGNVIDLKSDK